MTVLTPAKPRLRRRSLERTAMTPEQELELLIAEQERDDTYYVDRPAGEISLDALAPNGEGTIGELLSLDEDGYIVVPHVVGALRGGRSTVLGSSAPLGATEGHHGSIYAYRRLRCRCVPCTAAQAKAVREYRANRKEHS